MRLHFTIGCKNRRRTSRCRHGFQFSGIQVLFCWSCASTLRSLQQILFPLVEGLMAQAGTDFQKVRRMLFYVSILIVGYFWPASTLLHGHIALAIPSLPETDPQILEHWGYADEDHLCKLIRAKDFGLEFYCDVQYLSWISHVGLVSACLSSSVRLTTTSAAPCPERRNPIVVYSMICTQQVCDSTHDECHALQRFAPFYHDFCHGSQQVAMFYHAGHPSSTWLLHFCHHSFWTFYQVVHQPGDVHRNTFPQICNHSWSCRTSILEDAIFHRMEWGKFLWGNPCTAPEPFSHLGFLLWDFWISMHFSHSAAWKISEEDSAVSILHAYSYRVGNCNCLLSNTAR